MNRFERHPVLTAIGLIGLLAGALLLVTESMLGSFQVAGVVSDKRHLAMREWLPGSTRSFRTPSLQLCECSWLRKGAGPCGQAWRAHGVFQSGTVVPTLRWQVARCREGGHAARAGCQEV